jgi:hypothetical protein
MSRRDPSEFFEGRRRANRDKKRRWRERRRAGRCVVRADVDEAALVVALIDAGLLSVNDESHAAIEGAFQRLVDKLIE